MVKIRMTAIDADEEGILDPESEDIVELEVADGDLLTMTYSLCGNDEVQAFFQSLFSGKFGEGKRIIFDRIED